MDNNENSYEETSSQAKAWIQENLRIIVSVFIVAAIALGIYSYSQRAEIASEDDDIAALLDTKGDDQEATDEGASMDASTGEGMMADENKGMQNKVVITEELSQETDTAFVEKAASGDGKTHLPGRQVAKIGMLPGVRNNGHAEPVVLRLDHGEAYAVQAYRPFVHQQMRRVRRVLKGKPPAATGFQYLQTRGHRVYVALHHMTIQPSAQRQATLQVHQTTGLPVAQVAAEQRFFYRSHRMHVGRQADHGQAYAVMADALVNLQLPGKRTFQGKMPVRTVFFDGADSTQSFNNTSEHGEMD